MFYYSLAVFLIYTTHVSQLMYPDWKLLSVSSYYF